MKLIRWSCLALLPLIAVGCGDDDDSGNNPTTANGTVNETVASAVTTETFNALQEATGGDGRDAAFTLMAIGLSAISMVTPSGAQPAVIYVENLPPAGDFVNELTRDGVCECDENSCTFDGCGDTGGLAITGTMSWSNSTMDADYTVGGSYGGSTYTYGIFSDLDFTATSITGVVSTDGDFSTVAEGTTVQSLWDTSVTFNNVTFSGSGQPTGGSIDVSAAVTANGESYSATGSVSF
jgi:hypothetical protein